MKVTVCFDDIKVIVPCGNCNSNNPTTSSSTSSLASLVNQTSNDLGTLCSNAKYSSNIKLTASSENENNANPRVIDVIANAILRYKKATKKVRILLF